MWDNIKCCSLWLSYVCVFQSVVCYVKAAFPHILELLNTQFRYAKDSDNYRYTNSLKNLIYNIYSQRCIPPINEEIEVSPSIYRQWYLKLSIVINIMEEDFWLLLLYISNANAFHSINNSMSFQWQITKHLAALFKKQAKGNIRLFVVCT